VFVGDDSETGFGLGELVEDGRRTIGRRVVDDRDIAIDTQNVERTCHPFDHLGDGRLVVVTGKERGNRADRRKIRPHNTTSPETGPRRPIGSNRSHTGP
jgi:hypothetical protein